jgi:hypothetical protein
MTYLEGAWSKDFPDVPIWNRVSEYIFLSNPKKITTQASAASKKNRKHIVGWDGNGTIEHYNGWVEAAKVVGRSPEALANAARSGSYSAGRYWMKAVW